MSSSSQRRAVDAHRRRLAERGLGRFEVRGLNVDKDLLRGLARRLAVGDEAATALRAELARQVAGGGQQPAVGGVLAALRRSPLVGGDLGFEREVAAGRDLEL